MNSNLRPAPLSSALRLALRCCAAITLSLHLLKLCANCCAAIHRCCYLYHFVLQSYHRRHVLYCKGHLRFYARSLWNILNPIQGSTQVNHISSLIFVRFYCGKFLICIRVIFITLISLTSVWCFEISDTTIIINGTIIISGPIIIIFIKR